MILYEVNVTIHRDIFDAYYHWLLKHINTMLTFQGFLQADITQEVHNADNPTHAVLSIRYTIENEKYLNEYLDNHASVMRKEAIDQFGCAFSATRRHLIPLSLVK